MQIQLDEFNKITGICDIGEFENGVEINPNIITENFKNGFKPNKFLYENGQIIENLDYIEPISQEIFNKISELKQKLFETDYQAIKYAEGLITTSEYIEIKQQRQEWRDEINALQQEYNLI